MNTEEDIDSFLAYQRSLQREYTRAIPRFRIPNLTKEYYRKVIEKCMGHPGSPDKAGGEIPQTKRKVIHLHHEHTRTFSIGAVDSAIRDTFKL